MVRFMQCAHPLPKYDDLDTAASIYPFLLSFLRLWRLSDSLQETITFPQ